VHRASVSDPALELLSVTVRYRAGGPGYPSDVIALDDVSLVVARSECVGVVGEAGAGKTTLLLCAAGILNADAGVVRCGSAEYVSRHGIGHPSLSLRSSIELAASLREASGCDDGFEASVALRRARLSHLADVRVVQLAPAMRARALVAHALLGQPSVLCLDDSLALLDATGRRDYAKLLGELRADGTAVVVAARDAFFLEEIASRVVMLHGGRMNATEPAGRTLELDVALPRHAAAVLADRVPAVRRRGRALRVSLDRISAEEVLSTCVSLGISVYGSRVIGAATGKVAERRD
jgi:ABC-type multidrug transport system ATPase subunit